MSVKIPTLSERDLQRFWKKVRKTKTCWLWEGGIVGNNYGGFWLSGLTRGAHRVSWTIAYGPIPIGMSVLHDCPDGDNKLCVNPLHLWLGTTDANMKDAGEKGQMPRGERNSHAILTTAQVIAIREIPRSVSHRQIGNRYGVAKGTVAKIRNGANWRHLL